MYHWDLSLMWEYKSAFLQGLKVTLELTTISVCLGTVIGYVFGFLLTLAGKPLAIVRFLIYFYTAIFGWLPLLVILVVMYYFLPNLFGLRVDAYTISWVALSLNLGAFITDIVRGAVTEIPRAFIEAGMAVGMNKILILKRIVLPEIIRSTLPANVALYINQFKWTTLCSVIGVEELLHKTDTILIHTYRALEAYLAITIIYLIVIGIGNAFYLWLKKFEFFKQRA